MYFRNVRNEIHKKKIDDHYNDANNCKSVTLCIYIYIYILYIYSFTVTVTVTVFGAVTVGVKKYRSIRL